MPGKRLCGECLEELEKCEWASGTLLRCCITTEALGRRVDRQGGHRDAPGCVGLRQKSASLFLRTKSEGSAAGDGPFSLRRLDNTHALWLHLHA
jgi:hypothetical protein